MNCKSKGSRTERKAKAILEQRGYQLAMKSGASLGVFDLIAGGVDYDHALLIQVKSNRMPCKSEMDRLRAFQCPNFRRKQVWVFRDREKEPVFVEL